MLRVLVVLVVVLAAVSVAVSAKFRRSALEPSVVPTLDVLHVHLRNNPYGVDDDIAPQP
jgi:hypothetical protein